MRKITVFQYVKKKKKYEKYQITQSSWESIGKRPGK